MLENRVWHLMCDHVSARRFAKVNNALNDKTYFFPANNRADLTFLAVLVVAGRDDFLPVFESGFGFRLFPLTVERLFDRIEDRSLYLAIFLSSRFASVINFEHIASLAFFS